MRSFFPMVLGSPMANRLGLSVATVRHWVRDGRLRAERHGRKATWLINTIDEQPEEIHQLAARCAQSQAPRSTPHDSTPPELRARVDELLLEGYYDATIAECLNNEGWTNLEFRGLFCLCL